MGIYVRELVFCSQEDESLRLFSNVLRNIEMSYVDEVDTEKLVYDGISGMLNKLDPHSNFLDKVASKEMKEDQEGSFFGIGIQFNMIEDKITVITPIEGTPAYKAGLRAGDRIVEINGENAIGISQRDVLKKLKGPKGTSVDIGVEREGLKELLEFTLIRDKIPSVSVPYSFMLNDDIGYIRIIKFSQTTYNETEAAITELEENNLKGLIIDLRSNQGGLLDQAIKVSDMFIEGGKEIVSTRGRIRGSDKKYYSTNKFTHPFYPIVVLVNYGTASGAEILAGAIQDHDRGIILGSRTWGKGLVQNMYPLPMGCTVIITTQKYYTPSGRCIQKSYEEYKKIFRDPNLESEAFVLDENANKEIFYTELKRKVYGGGGITPDVFFKVNKISDSFKILILNDLITRFGMHYATFNKDLPYDFQIDDVIMKEFETYVKDKNIEVDFSSIKDEMGEIKLWLKRDILTSLFGSEKSAEFWMKNDPEVIKAIELIPESAALMAKRIAFNNSQKK